MELIGIRGLTHKLFTSYLLNRAHKMKIGKSVSTEMKINIGVLQGSLLGPVFFLIHSNNILNLKSTSEPIPYADHTTLLFRIKMHNTLYKNAMMAQLVFKLGAPQTSYPYMRRNLVI